MRRALGTGVTLFVDADAAFAGTVPLTFAEFAASLLSGAWLTGGVGIVSIDLASGFTGSTEELLAAVAGAVAVGTVDVGTRALELTAAM